ncbi:hypothetical protein D3C87_2085560 [compost metagenome]
MRRDFHIVQMHFLFEQVKVLLMPGRQVDFLLKWTVTDNAAFERIISGTQVP